VSSIRSLGSIRRVFALIVVLAALTVLVVVLVAGPSGAAKAPSNAPLKIAGLFDITGPASGHQGDTFAVLQAWAKDANAHGGVAGHPVAVSITDTQGNPAKAAAAARKIIGDPSVIGVVVVDGSAEAQSALPLAKAGVPVIGGIGYNPAVWGTTKGNRLMPIKGAPNVFPIATGGPASGASLIVAARGARLNNIVTVDFSQVPVSKEAGRLGGVFAKFYKMKYGQLTIDATAPNFTAECIKIVQRRTNYLNLVVPESASVKLLRDCRTQGYKGSYGLAGGALTHGFVKAAGDAKLTGGLFGFPWFSNEAPAVRYRTVMKAYRVPVASWANGTATPVWTTMEMFKKALNNNRSKLGKSVTRQKVLAAYRTIKNETLGGLLPGPANFTKNPVDTPQRCFWTYRYENRRFSGSWKPVCPPPGLGVG
jgi:branched-chain amino acid transport system substrate-binding protein